MYQWICSPILCVVFLFCWFFPLLCKNFLVWWSPICLFYLLFPLPGEIYLIKKFLWAMSKICCLCFLLVFFFMVSGLTFKSLVHFEFIFVCGVRRCYSFISLHISVQFSQHHFLNKLSLAHCMCLLPLSNTIKVWVYFWALYSVPLIYVSIFMLVPCCFDYYGLILWFDIS